MYIYRFVYLYTLPLHESNHISCTKWCFFVCTRWLCTQGECVCVWENMREREREREREGEREGERGRERERDIVLLHDVNFVFFQIHCPRYSYIYTYILIYIYIYMCTYLNICVNTLGLYSRRLLSCTMWIWSFFFFLFSKSWPALLIYICLNIYTCIYIYTDLSVFAPWRCAQGNWSLALAQNVLSSCNVITRATHIYINIYVCIHISVITPWPCAQGDCSLAWGEFCLFSTSWLVPCTAAARSQCRMHVCLQVLCTYVCACKREDVSVSPPLLCCQFWMYVCLQVLCTYVCGCVCMREKM